MLELAIDRGYRGKHGEGVRVKIGGKSSGMGKKYAPKEEKKHGANPRRGEIKGKEGVKKDKKIRR